MASGFKGVRKADGSAYNAGGLWCVISVTNAKRLAVGDTVKLFGSSEPGFARNADVTDSQFPNVVVANAGDTVYGVVTEIEADFGRSLNDITVPSLTTGRVLVETDPNIIFEIDTSGTALVEANVGLNFDILATEATQTGGLGRSNQTLNGTAGGTTATKQLRLEGIKTLTPTGTNPQVAYVRLNESRFSTAVGV